MSCRVSLRDTATDLSANEPLRDDNAMFVPRRRSRRAFPQAVGPYQAYRKDMTMTLTDTAAIQMLTRRRDTQITAAITAAVLLVVVSFLHLADQNFLAFDKQPAYLLAAYVTVEILAPLVALTLLRPTSGGWLLVLGCAAGPLTGYLLTRTIGLPGDTSDIGNWGEPLGVASVMVESTLLLIALVELLRLRSIALHA